MNLKNLKKKKLSELTIPEMREIVKSKERQEVIKHDIRSRIFTKFSVYQTIFFLHLGFSANIVTYMWAFLGLLSTLLLWAGQYWMNIAFIILLYISSFIDHSDGEIARYNRWRKGIKCVSLKGLYLEDISHFFIRVLIFFGIGIGAWMRFQNIYYFYAGVALTLLLLLDQVVKLREYDILIKKDKLKFLEEAKEYKSHYAGKLTKIYDLFKPERLHSSLFFWVALFNVLHWFLIITLLLFILLFIKNFYMELKRLQGYDEKLNKSG